MRRILLQLPLLLRIALRGWMALALCCAMGQAAAQGIELTALQVQRVDGVLALDYHARVSLSHAVEDALQRGVPMYFNAQAVVYRGRWYWLDERVARVNRVWRLSFQPLTASWRVSMGGLSQSYATLAEAMAPILRVGGWRLADVEKLEPGERYYVEFSLQLDNSQLPRPMQIDIGQDWRLSVERSLRVE